MDIESGSAQRRRRGQRGQTLILFVAIFSVILAMGAVALDQGLAYARHGQAQNRADAASRAGAYACLLALSNGASPGSACIGTPEGAAVVNAEANLANSSEVATTPSGNCNGTNDMPSMQVVVQRDSPSLFLKAFGQSGWTASALATNCVGEVSRLASGITMDMIPTWFAQPGNSSHDPNRRNCGAGSSSSATVAGRQCVIFSTEDPPTTGTFYDPSGSCGPATSSGIAAAIQSGIPGYNCPAGHTVINYPGSSGWRTGILNAFEGRLPASGEPCGGGADIQLGLQAAVQKLDGYDAWPEGIGGGDDPASVYRQRTCVSQRLVLVPLVTGSMKVQGFAAVYIEGCWTDAVGAPNPWVEQLNQCDSDDRGTNDGGSGPGHTNTRVWGVIFRVYLPGVAVKQIDSINNNGGGLDGAAALAIQTTK